MKLSTRGRYGTRALLDIALQGSEQPVLLKDIARRQEISLRYLEQLITPLITAGIVRSARGRRGGVLLARPPEEIKLSEVIQTLEGSIGLVDCVKDPGLCHRSSFCVSHDIWLEVNEKISRVLESVTLYDLVERHKKKEQFKGVMYHI